MVEVSVARLGRDAESNSYVVILQEKGGERVLPIWIGKPEAESIVLHIHNVKRPRPITHDLVKNLIIGLGAQLRRVYITRVADQTYFAELQLVRDDALVNIDARPSDCIAIALRLGAPIFAADQLLSEPEDDTSRENTGEDEPVSPSDSSGYDSGETAELTDAELTAEQLKRYLETLRPEDFGKFRP